MVELSGLVRQHLYVDSAALMRLAERIRALPGVAAAAALVATDANRQWLADAGLLVDAARAAGPDDIMVCVRAEDAAAAQAALAEAEALLSASGPGAPASVTELLPRSVRSATRRSADAAIALISVPGRYAAAEAHQALSAGLHVFLFSDDVPLDAEVALKRRGRARGLLVMGPECGTSIVGGVGLGFANRIRRGSIGLVGASGTGLQEVTTLIHRFGGGVSQAIGTGGRDLSETVGGLTTLHALEWLGADAATTTLVVVSKPGSDAVAERVLAAAAQTGKPVIACLLGWRGAPPAGVQMAATLEAAAQLAIKAAGETAPSLSAPPVAVTGAGGMVHGLFTGGTLCEEAAAIVGKGTFVDFGAERYTRGRPHPMIDPQGRNAAVEAAGQAAEIAVVLVDVVLGSGAHPDPAGALCPAVRAARASAMRAGRTLHVVGHVVGTDADPQGLTRQEEALRAAGVHVCPSNRLAADLACALAMGSR